MLSEADFVVTYTISIDRDGNVYNDVQTHGSTFADVYRAFHSIKTEVDRQIAERRNCPYNPKSPEAGRRALGDPT
jgi:hypothetical protein